MAVAESQNIQSDLIPKIATGFCSGIARTGSFCGALSGAIMSLGLLMGRSEAGVPVDDLYEVVQELIQKFDEKFGAVECQSLTGVKLWTEEGQNQFRERNQIQNCLDYSEFTTQIVFDLFESESKTRD